MTAADVAKELKRPIALWREADPNMRRLIWISFVEMLAVNAYFSLIVPFAKIIGLDSRAVGALNSLMQVVSAVVAVGAGVLADRFGRKSIYTVGQLIRVAITVALLTTRSYLGLALVFVLRGLAAIQGPAQSAITANLTRRENRATMLGLSQTLGQLASVLMPIASGAIADRYGAKASFAIALVLAALAVVMGLGLKDKPTAPGEADSTADAAGAGADARTAAEAARVGQAEPLLARVRRMFSGKRAAALSLLMAATVFNGLGNGAANILLPFTIMDRFSSAYTVVASASSMMALGTMLVLLVGGRLADVSGRRTMVMTSGTIFPLLMLGVFYINSLWELNLVLVLVSMVGNISSPAIGAVYMEAVEDRDRATFAGLQMSLNAAGMALGSAIAGAAYKVSPTWAWLGVIAVMVLQVVCFHFVLPHDGKRRAAASTSA